MNERDSRIRKDFVVLAWIGTWISVAYVFWALYVAFAMDRSVVFSIVLVLAVSGALAGVKYTYHRTSASLSDAQQSSEDVSSSSGKPSAFQALKWPVLAPEQARIRNLAAGVGAVAAVSALVSARFSDMATSIMMFSVISQIGWSIIAMAIVFRR